MFRPFCRHFGTCVPTYSVLSQSGMAHISSLVSNMAAALQILWVFPKLTTKVNKSLTMPAYVNEITLGWQLISTLQKFSSVSSQHYVCLL